VSNDKIVKGYGRWLTWLDRRELLDPDDPSADQITPVRVREYIAYLEKNNASQTLLARLQELREAAMVMAPGGNWAWINRIASSVRARHKPARPKRSRLVGAGKLFDLGLELMAGAPKEDTMRLCAITYRDGLLVAVLAARPLEESRRSRARSDPRLTHRRMVDTDPCDSDQDQRLSVVRVIETRAVKIRRGSGSSVW
jgi:integrase/recombinase XerD